MIATVAVVLAASAGTAHAAPGDLDRSFDGDGRKTFGYGGYDHANGVAVQPDGRIVLAGSGGPNFDFAVTRLNPDGSFDTTFDGDGTAGADFGGDDYGEAAALQPDGKIVVAGYTSVDHDIAVARFNRDGSLDATFDPGGVDGPGKKTFGYGGNDLARSVLVAPDGKIVVAGNGNANYDFAITRLNSDGSFDASFDGDGTAGADFGGVDYSYAVAAQPDGRVVVAGETTIKQDVAVARFNPTGPADMTLDATFDGDGVTTFGYGGTDGAQALALQPDGKIVVVGYGAPSGAVAATRLLPDGSPDSSFDGDGTAGIKFGGLDRNDIGYAVALAPDGKIVVAGRADLSDDNTDFALVRLQPGGALDTTFSFDGKTTLSFGGSDEAAAVALQPDGAIVVAGDTSVNDDIAVARLEGDPAAAKGGGPGTGGSGAGGPATRPAATGVPRCAGHRATIVGTAKADVLRGTPRADVIVALGGNDRVTALGGRDIVCGGKGNDRLLGGSGTDRLDGEQGNDTLSGGQGRDRLTGGPQRDSCVGGAGRDRATTCETRRSL